MYFSSPVRSLDQSQAGGGLGEHCSSPAVGRGVCAPPGRVAQPRLLAADRGYRVAAANRGRLFFGYLLLAKQKKVTSCQATPDGFDFDVGLCNEHSGTDHQCFARSQQPNYLLSVIDIDVSQMIHYEL